MQIKNYDTANFIDNLTATTFSFECYFLYFTEQDFINILDKLNSGKPRTLDFIYDYLDYLLYNKKYDLINKCLAQTIGKEIHLASLLSMLTITLADKNKLHSRNLIIDEIINRSPNYSSLLSGLI